MPISLDALRGLDWRHQVFADPVRSRLPDHTSALAAQVAIERRDIADSSVTLLSQGLPLGDPREIAILNGHNICRKKPSRSQLGTWVQVIEQASSG